MSTSSIRKRSIQWSPHNKSSFVVGSNDLRLYNFKYLDNKENKEPQQQSPVNNNNNNNINNNNNNISPRLKSSKYMETYNFDIEYPPDDWEPVEKKTISLVSINSDVQLMKCMSWCPDQSDQNLIACGLTSGRAILTSFSSVNRVLKELVPKHTRSCNAIAWNPIYTNQLAVGLDKVRGDSSTLIWDINYLQSINNKQQSNFYQQQNNNNNNITRSPINNGNVDQPYPMSQISDNSFSTSTEYSDTIYQPISEFTQSESTLALAWLPNNPSCLLVGTGSKWLKLYDIRDTNNSQSVMAHQKSVNGVCVDPFDCNRIATNSEDSNIKIWDLRQLDDPIMIVNSNCKSIQQIDWCPTRSGVLASVGKDKATVKLWDIKAPFSNSDLQSSSTISTSTSLNKSPKLEPSKSSSSSTLSSQLKSNSTTINISGTNNNININSSSGGGSGRDGRDGSSGSGSKDTSGNKDNNGNHDNVNTISKPTKTHHSSEIISSFSWHPTNECRMLTVSFSGVIEVVSLNENIPISWSPHGALCFSFGNNVLEGPSKGQSLEPNLEHFKNLTNDGRYEKDISLKIRERAIQGYSANIEENINLSSKINDESINFLWNWIKKTPTQIQNFKKDTITTANATTSTNSNNEFIGIYNILIEKDVSTVEPSNGFLIYKSPNRNLCLSICGWGFNQNLPLENILSRLEKQGDYERAAAIAVFHLDIKRAILVLTNACYNIHPVTSNNHHGHFVNRDREFNFKVLSIALSGFDGNNSGSSNQIWKETCRSTARSSFSNQPYLKTCLEFLSSSAESKEIYGIIDDSKISLDDKIAFSCKYLDYQDLIHFVERNTIRVIECGNLVGVLLTGLTGRGVDLFSNYIDRTCDIQTAALAMTMVVPKTFRDKRVAKWYSIYSDLLDTWELWHQRAILDIQRVSTGTSSSSGNSLTNTPTSTSTPIGGSGSNSINSSTNSNSANNSNNDLFPLQPQIFAKCGFCQNSFSFESVSVSSMVGRNASKPNFKAKVPFCPHCKQSLPRCCLCLLPLNCMVPTPDFKKGGIPTPSPHQQQHSNITPHHSHTSTIHQHHHSHNNTDNSQFWSQGSESFEDWFTWCQTCRHGGHSQHILDWFKDHTTCPVTSCECRCSQL